MGQRYPVVRHMFFVWGDADRAQDAIPHDHTSLANRSFNGRTLSAAANRNLTRIHGRLLVGGRDRRRVVVSPLHAAMAPLSNERPTAKKKSKDAVRRQNSTHTRWSIAVRYVLSSLLVLIAEANADLYVVHARHTLFTPAMALFTALSVRPSTPGVAVSPDPPECVQKLPRLLDVIVRNASSDTN